MVYSIIPRGSLDLVPLPNKTRVHDKAMDFVTGLQNIHKQVHDNLVEASSKYKLVANKKQYRDEFSMGNYVWAILTKDHFSSTRDKTSSLPR